MILLLEVSAAHTLNPDRGERGFDGAVVGSSRFAE